MNATAPSVKCSRDQVREAAVWLTLLRGPDRTKKLERGFRRWLSANPAHATAFETVSEAWETAGAFPRGPFPHLSRWQRAGFRRGFLQVGAALTAVAAIAVLGLFLHQREAGIATSVGEQRMLTLPDGSRVFLNTDSRVVIEYDRHERRVVLKSGEAYFEVTRKDASRPFIVAAGDRNIRALATSFIVRRDERQLAVTLIEGKVAVSPATEQNLAANDTSYLTPGQRLTFTGYQPPRLDQPPLDKVTAWRSGYVDLAEVSLADAVAEMNRYSTVKMVVVEPEAAAVPVSGIFRAGDTTSFANAVADSYGLHVDAESNRIVLQGKPTR